MVSLPERRILAATTVERLETSPDNRMSSLIGSFDLALGKVLRDIVEWTLTRPETRRYQPEDIGLTHVFHRQPRLVPPAAVPGERVHIVHAAARPYLHSSSGPPVPRTD